ncbi:MAG TPA: galactokinase, partial [Candidatus Limnocylindria bacterium]|nr:galactokinase [Candidatus Limnocylindria bacterium]
ENLRVGEAMDALRLGDLSRFFRAVNESGMSSWTLLQNVHLGGADQPMAVALARAQSVLGREGACRVHGGGFAGTTLNFVPLALLDDFTRAMEEVFGQGCCQALDVRAAGPETIPLP